MTTQGAFPNRIAHSELSELRNQLIKIDAWPEAGDQYISLLSHSLWDKGSTQPKDYEWIPRVVKDAHQGIDIGLQYPSFFQKLITNHKLRDAFLKKLKNHSPI